MTNYYNGGYDGGYDGFSMSNRAREAYDDGKKPLSKIDSYDLRDFNNELANMGINAKLNNLYSFKEFMKKYGDTGEWHHTSLYGNKTTFYDFEYALERIIEQENRESIINSFNDKKPTKDNDSKWFTGTFSYLVWSGSRAHPRANKKTINNAIIEQKGNFYIVYDLSGDVIVRKKIDSNGTYLSNKKEIDLEETQNIFKENAKIKTEEKQNNKISNTPKVNKISTPNIERLSSSDIEKIIDRSSDDYAKNFIKENYANDNYDMSKSRKLYPKGRKPAPEQYFNPNFEIGEQIYVPNEKGGYKTQVWNGNEFVDIPNVSYSFEQ